MSIAENYRQIQDRINAACQRAGRDPATVLLLPVSKGHSAHAVQQAADLGLRVFGENKVQEAKIKISQCPSRLEWHMIGHLQSNKARDAVQLFSMIESIDSLELAAFDAVDFRDDVIAVAAKAGVKIYVDRLGPADNATAWQDADPASVMTHCAHGHQFPSALSACELTMVGSFGESPRLDRTDRSRRLDSRPDKRQSSSVSPPR